MEQELTAQDIKDIRGRYGLSQKSFARILGLGEASVARYEAGQKPSKANANLIRAAKIPRFMLDCLRRDGDALTERERDSVSKIIYTEVYFGEGEDDMDMTQLYEITLSQEVLNEKAAEIMAELFHLEALARQEGDEIRELMFSDLADQIALLKPTIATNQNASQQRLSEIKGELDAYNRIISSCLKKVA